MAEQLHSRIIEHLKSEEYQPQRPRWGWPKTCRLRNKMRITRFAMRSEN